jgi:flagellar protein FliS
MYANSRAQYQAQAVETASPAQLVLMLYDGALAAMVRARLGDEQPDRVEVIHGELTKAQAIITELLVTLDLERGGVIAANLASLYDFCLDRLLSANLSKDLSQLDAVEAVVRDLRDAWEQSCVTGLTAVAG